MGLFDDINQFLEERLDEFLRNNPHLELQAIEDRLRQQEQDTKKLIIELQREEKRLQDEIMAIAKDIQIWHGRVSKAQTANRPDLAEAAREREASLLRQGNQVWSQMERIKQRTVQAKELLQQVQQKCQQVKAEAEKERANKASRTNGYTVGWEQAANSNYSRAADPLEAEFQKWELDDELDRLKRNM
jgi:uncharacterized protein (TIGR04376 family)